MLRYVWVDGACGVRMFDVKGRERRNWKSVENKGFLRVWAVMTMVLTFGFYCFLQY